MAALSRAIMATLSVLVVTSAGNALKHALNSTPLNFFNMILTQSMKAIDSFEILRINSNHPYGDCTISLIILINFS